MKCEYCGGVICCEVCQRVPEDDTLRSRVAELEKLAYPDGPAGDAGVSAKRYMELEAEVDRLQKLYAKWGYKDAPCPKHSK